MKLKNLTQVWITSPIRTKTDGEFITTWTYKGTEWLNLQQDISELDKNEAGGYDYSILKGRTDKITTIINGDGIHLTNVSLSTNPKPDYTVKNNPKIGKTTTLTLELYKGV